MTLENSQPSEVFKLSTVPCELFWNTQDINIKDLCWNWKCPCGVNAQYVPRIMHMVRVCCVLAVIRYGQILPTSFRLTSLALGQSYNCPSANNDPVDWHISPSPHLNISIETDKQWFTHLKKKKKKIQDSFLIPKHLEIHGCILSTVAIYYCCSGVQALGHQYPQYRWN